MIKTLDLDDNIGHLFVADVKFNEKVATEQQLMCNEIFPPMIEKLMVSESNEQSLFQLIEQYSVTDKGKPKSYKPNKRSHSTMLEKNSSLFILKIWNF